MLILLFFCLNIHISAKRVNDSGKDINDNFYIFFSPITSSIIHFGYFLFAGYFDIYTLNQPKPIYLSLLVIVNIIPILKLYSKEYDINIKDTDVPVSYRDIFRSFYKEKNLIEINKDYIYSNDFRFSLRHSENRHSIIAFRDIDDEKFLKIYFMEKGIKRLGFHYHNIYFELTDEEYNNMINDLKNKKDVIFVNYPYIAVNNVNIYIRNDGIKYSVVFLKEEKEKLYYANNLLKNISKRAENDKYICYSNIKKKDIIPVIQKY